MTFGLHNAAQTFQRFMDEVVRELKSCYAYLISLWRQKPQKNIACLACGHNACR